MRRSSASGRAYRGTAILANARLAAIVNQGSGLTLRCHQTTLPRQRFGVFMSNLRLTFACGPYDRTQALRDGTIRPEGIELTYLALQPAEIFWRMLQYREFDASEMSLSNYTTLLDKG